jgi:hypothetical protein
MFADFSTAAEYHVAKTGLDGNPGTRSKPFKTISAAADVAHPGDTITVHEGTYREEVAPPLGGSSDDKRITYQKWYPAGPKIPMIYGRSKYQTHCWQELSR